MPTKNRFPTYICWDINTGPVDEGNEKYFMCKLMKYMKKMINGMSNFL